MYNQFTEIDQRPLNINKVVLDPMAIPKPGKRRKVKANSKNPYKIKKVKLLGYESLRQKRLDGFAILKMLKFQHPREVIRADISYKRIVEINPDHLKYFSNLKQLNCSENEIHLEMLKTLPNVQVIDISHNNIRTVPLELHDFRALKTLNMSFNSLQFQYMPHLAMIPQLQSLNLSCNDLRELPEQLGAFELLEHLDISNNMFSSEYKAAFFWGSLSTIKQLVNLNISRNKLRGIHTERLSAGNFGRLQILDFSYNRVQNQHNLICARNFTELKKLIVSGNPFAVENEFKGLEMEIYARTGAQLIITDPDQYYLRKSKEERVPIKFDNIVKIDTQLFPKNKNVLLGIEMPKDEDFSQSSEEQEEEPDEQAVFMTEQINAKIGKDSQKAKESSEVSKSQSRSELKNQPSERSIRSGDSNMEYKEFKKVAAELLGDQRNYKQAFDINTAYKALRSVVSRVRNETKE